MIISKWFLLITFDDCLYVAVDVDRLNIASIAVELCEI